MKHFVSFHDIHSALSPVTVVPPDIFEQGILLALFFFLFYFLIETLEFGITKNTVLLPSETITSMQVLTFCNFKFTFPVYIVKVCSQEILLEMFTYLCNCMKTMK